MKKTQNVPYFAADIPFDVVYRNNSTSTPVKPHTHNALEIYFTLTDLPDVLLNDRVSGVPSGSLIVIPPHCIHQLFNQKLTIYERFIITINSTWIHNVLGKDSSLMGYTFFGSSPIIVTLGNSEVDFLCAALRDFMQKNKEPSLSLLSDLFSLLDKLDSKISVNSFSEKKEALSVSQSQKRINEIIAYINDNLATNLTLEQISGAFHLNKDYLARLFKEHTHSTIGHYIAVSRASLAQTLLSKGFTVSEVQEKLGFTSYAYFFKFFKKMTGVSPSHFRKNTYS